jgi:HSP20 family protein
MVGVDEAVEQLERLYSSVTGNPIPKSASPYAPIPPEKDPVRHVQEQLDRLLFVLGSAGPRAIPSTWSPRVSLWEGERETLIQVELPGVPRDGLSAVLSQGVLTVSGSRPLPMLGGGRPDLRAAEFPCGPFTRSLLLPPGAVARDIVAQLRDGILELRFPRMPGPSLPSASSQTIVVR